MQFPRVRRSQTEIKVFKDKLLRINWSNRSFCFRKIQKRWTFDLMVLEEPVATQIVEKMLGGKKDHFLVAHNSLDEKDIQHKTHLITLNRQEILIEEESGIHDFFVGFPLPNPETFSRKIIVTGTIDSVPRRLEHKRRAPLGLVFDFRARRAAMCNLTLLAALNRMGKLSIPDDFDDQRNDTDNPKGLRESKDYSASAMFARIQTLFDK